MALAMAARVEGRPMTAAQRQMEERCAAHQQRGMAKASAAAGLRSPFGVQGFLDRWGRERLAGLGCDCPGFRPAGEDVEQRCETRAVCPGQQGGPRVPDPERGSLGASAWIRQQLPDFARPGLQQPDAQCVVAECRRPATVRARRTAPDHGREADRTGRVKRELPLSDAAEIERLIRDFEALSLPRANWTHRAHLAVGVHYVRDWGLDGALQRMRERIEAYNLAWGDPDGYSEAITASYL